jgi:choline-phosphate cytidylyltransferase
MARSRRNLNDSRPASPFNEHDSEASSDERDDRSPPHAAEPSRGRTGKKVLKSDDVDLAA